MKDHRLQPSQGVTWKTKKSPALFQRNFRLA